MQSGEEDCISSLARHSALQGPGQGPTCLKDSGLDFVISHSCLSPLQISPGPALGEGEQNNFEAEPGAPAGVLPIRRH